MSKIHLKLAISAAIAVFSLTGFHSSVLAQPQPLAPQQGSITSDPIVTCMANQPAPVKHKNRPITMLFKGAASELGTDFGSMAHDSIFVFSDKDIDPFPKGNPKKPFTALEIRYVDGSSASVVKFPDDSYKIEGGFADGTIIAPSGPGTYIIAWPNGVRGKVVKAGGEVKIYRPDNTVTTLKKDMGGEYTISNSKLGYLGTARADTEGMQYEFHSKDF